MVVMGRQAINHPERGKMRLFISVSKFMSDRREDVFTLGSSPQNALDGNFAASDVNDNRERRSRNRAKTFQRDRFATSRQWLDFARRETALWTRQDVAWFPVWGIVPLRFCAVDRRALDGRASRRFGCNGGRSNIQFREAQIGPRAK